MSHHKYQIEAGQLLIETGQRVYVGVLLTFYIWDIKKKIAAYCTYSSNRSDKEWDRQEKAVANNTANARRIGIGRANSKKTITLADPIDMKLFKDGTPSSLSFDTGEGSSSKMTATVTLDKRHVILPFAILATLGAVPLNTRGTAWGTTDKTRRPKFPKSLIAEASQERADEE